MKRYKEIKGGRRTAPSEACADSSAVDLPDDFEPDADGDRRRNRRPKNEVEGAQEASPAACKRYRVFREGDTCVPKSSTLFFSPARCFLAHAGCLSCRPERTPPRA